MAMTHRHVVRPAIVAAALAIATASLNATTQAQPPDPADTEVAAPPGTYAANGVQTCLRQCHNKEPFVFVLQTPHAVKGDRRTPFAQHQCESCHGPSPEHIAVSAKPVTVVFKGPKASPIAERNAKCLSCHESGLRMNWRGSPHQKNEVACASCHTIHVEKDPVLLKTTQPAKCFACHKEQRAQANRLSHHPIIEGKIVCADCHNPHGSTQDKNLVRARVNDTCYKCHPDKRGPFLQEHAPVREDCTICHTPHGSTQARLLRERAPYLCQQCHDTSHHSGSPYGGETLIGGRAPQAQGLAKGCLNCHSQVHGSNNPSGVYNLR